MNQQPDKLFREKLEGYQKPAPASAWEKIAAAQTKKNDKWLWLKIAASIAFVAVAGYLVWSQDDTTGSSSKSLSIVEDETVTKETENKTAVVVTDDNELESPPAVASGKTSSPSEAKRKVVQKTLSAPEEQIPNIAQHTPAIDVSPAAEEDVSNEVALVENVNTHPVAETPVVTEAAPEKITLVYSAKDVEEYLDKKSLAEATSESKNPSTLKKLLKKANDLTNNQDPFGELRQMKNEILALNFKNEKQRGQNK